MNKKVAAFLGKHNFAVHQDINTIVDAMIFDMHQGLSGNESGQDMIKTWTNPPRESAKSKDVIVIDAGGTNFRSCLVSFDAKGQASITEMEKTKMPGVERLLSKKEFFDQIAVNLEHLKDKSENIGFCFSYPVKMLENGDGILINFSKEVKAPEVEGSQIGKELLSALKEHGWKKDLHVTLLNDTVSALLAGAADATEGVKYSSFVGFILGTGMNAAYIQRENTEFPGLKTQIINCEAGKFNRVARSDFDLSADSKSERPGLGIMEKLCSGAYLGAVSFEAMIQACKEGLFSEKVCKALGSLSSLTLIEVNTFLHSPWTDSNIIGKILSEEGTEEDVELVFGLFDALCERCARMAAAILISCVVQSEGGKNVSEPVCILCNGTTFYKTYKVRQRVLGYLEEYLVNQRGLYYNVISLDDDITLGTAIGGLIK